MHSASMYPLFEIIAVSVLVLGCAVYCAWRLTPDAVARRVLATLLALPLPAALKLRLASGQKAAGCGASCSGCASATPRQSNQTRR
jgi:hypothetical protein